MGYHLDHRQRCRYAFAARQMISILIVQHSKFALTVVATGHLRRFERSGRTSAATTPKRPSALYRPLHVPVELV